MKEKEMTIYHRHAVKELDILNREYGSNFALRQLSKDIENLLEAFGDKSHDPGMAILVGNTVRTLLNLEPLSHLTGEPEEWKEAYDLEDGTIVYVNKRCPDVYKEGLEGDAYYKKAVEFVTPDGRIYTNFGKEGSVMFNGKTLSSIQYIKSFPFLPKKFSIKVETKSTGVTGYIRMEPIDEETTLEMLNYYKQD